MVGRAAIPPVRSARRAVAAAAAHVAMFALMAVPMLPGAPAVTSLASAGVLLGGAVLVAPAARRRPVIGGILVDACAMALLLAADATAGAAPGEHHAGAGALPLALVAVVGWAALRVPGLRDARSRIMASVTGAGLLAMLLGCAIG